jgi:hypothetical protein
MVHLRARKLETSNIEHRTSNAQFSRHWMLGFGCWMFRFMVREQARKEQAAPEEPGGFGRCFTCEDRDRPNRLELK